MHDLRPPTDCLYKFVAIFGIVLTAAGAYLLQAAADDFGADMSERFRMAMWERVHRIRFEAVQERLKRATDADAAQLRKDVDELVETTLNDLLQTEVKANMTWTLSKVTVLPAAGVCLLLGLVVTPIGFRLWYNRVQKFQDELLAAQLRAAQLAGSDSRSLGT